MLSTFFNKFVQKSSILSAKWSFPRSLIILFFSFSCCAEPPYQLSVCMIFRNEAPFLKEWIEFHRIVGVQHFYLCNHNSEDAYLEVLTPYIKKGVVELSEVYGENDKAVDSFNRLQMECYNRILKLGKDDNEWIAFLDSDEYLVPTDEKKIIDVLKDFKKFGGVAVNWQMFGTSHVEKLRPDRLLIEQLIYCASGQSIKENLTIKSILQPKRVVGFEFDPHSPTYRPGYFQVNTDKVRFKGPFSPYVQVDKLRINHYWTRDEDYFENYKIPRRVGWHGWSVEGIRNIGDTYNQDCDLTIQRFVPLLRRKMGLP